MRAVIQRVTSARVTIKQTGEQRAIGPGLVTLLGIGPGDTFSEAQWMADKLTSLRIFEDADGKMNYGLLEIPNAAMLIVSQFTLQGDARKGRRPSFTRAASPEIAAPLYEAFAQCVREIGIPVQTGEFGADMRVEIENDGPVTLVIDTPPNQN